MTFNEIKFYGKFAYNFIKKFLNFRHLKPMHPRHYLFSGVRVGFYTTLIEQRSNKALAVTVTPSCSHDGQCLGLGVKINSSVRI